MGVFSHYLGALKKLSAFDSTHQLFGFVGFERGAFIMEGGGLALPFICQPTPGGNETIKNALDSLYKKGFPPDTTIAAQLVALPDVSNYAHGYEDIRGNRMMGNDNEMTQSMAKSLIEDIESKVFTDMLNGGRIRDFEFWFTIRVPTMELVPNEREFQRFASIIVDLEESLSSAGLLPYRATPNDLLWRLQCLFNSNPDALWRKKFTGSAARTFNDQIVELGMTVNFNGHGVVIGKPLLNMENGETQFEKGTETHVSVMSLESWPEYLYYGQMLDLLGSWRDGQMAHGDPFIVSTIIHFPEQSEAKKKIEYARGWLLGQAKGKVLEWFQGLASQKKDYDQLWHEINEQGAQVTYAGTHVLVFSSDAERAQRNSAKMLRYFETKRVTFVKESALSGPLFLQNIPCMTEMSYTNFKRHFTYSSEALSYMTPHMSSWKGNTSQPVIPLTTRLGQIFYWDLFKTDGGFNFLLSAATGRGKSVLVNYIINCYLNSGVLSGGSLLRKAHQQEYELKAFDDGAQVFMLDSGGSYKNLADIFQDSQYIRFNGDFKYSMNPFPSIHQWAGEDGQGPMILSMFMAMAAPQHGVSETQRAEMMTMLTAMWNEHGKNSTVTMFVERCLAHEKEFMQQIGMQLKIFAEGGVYGHLFTDKRPPIDFDGRLVVVELEDLATDLHLQMVVILGVINQIQHKIFMGGTARKSLFLLEEAWQWLTVNSATKMALTEFVGEFLQAAFRKFRKVRASGGIITQNFMDATQNSVGQAIVANTDWKIFLGQDPSSIERIKNSKSFSASDAQFEQMKTVHTKKGKYSEIMIFNNGVSEICRLELDPETLMIFSTDPDDRELMGKYRAQGNSVQEAARMSVTEKASRSAH
jgi:conjugal transfer ATP-binding protein TraC